MKKKCLRKRHSARIMSGIAATALLVSSGVLPIAQPKAAEEGAEGKLKALRLVYDEPVPQVLETSSDPNNFAGWREYSIPMGNAYMGVNLFGGVGHDRIQITENSLQDSNSSIGGLNNFSETYLDFDHDYADVTGYQRELSLEEGITTVEYDYNGTHYTREYFASYPDKVLVVHLESDGSGKLDFTLRPTIPYICDGRDVDEDGVISGEDEESRGKSGKVVAEDDRITLAGEMEYYGLEFEGQYKVLTDGDYEAVNDGNGENGVIEVKNADSATIIMGLDTNFDMESKLFTQSDPKEKLEGNEPAHDRVNAVMEAVDGKEYSELKENHLSDYQSMYGRVDVDLGGSVPEGLMTDELVANYKNGDYDNSAEGLYLETLAYQYGRYLLICSSREGGLPTNLQGIWNVYQDPSWRAGMWHNINEQMNYWGAFTSNLAETFEPYIDYWQAYVKKAESYATSNISKYNPDGQMEGTADYDDGWALGNSTWPYNISGSASHSGFGTGPFMSIIFWDYYDYTRDLNILEEKTYPAISGMSKFLSKIVKEDEDGKLLAQHSFSPKVQVATESGTESYGTVGCTFDQSMIYENHLDTVKAAEILQENGIVLTEEDEAAVSVFKEQLSLLDPILVGSSGQLKEYREEDYYGEIGTEPTHRHTSQLVGVYPGSMVNSTTPAWQDAARVSLSKREESPDLTKGWSKAHRAAIWARLYEGDKAYQNYQKLIKVNLMSNLFNDHNGSSSSSSRLFQADANYGITAAVSEMLLQSHEGFIAPLAGLPSRWENGSYDGLSARGNFEVSARWTDGQADSFTILSKSGGECKVKYDNVASAVVTDEDGSSVSFTADGDDMIIFDTAKGQSYTISGLPFRAAVQDASNLTLNVNPDKQLEVSWKASPDAVSYNIYRAEESSAVYERYAEGVAGVSYTGDFKEGVQATYKLTAVSADGTESKGIYMTFVPTKKADSAKGYFLEDGSLQIQVEDAQRADDTEYILYRAEKDGYTELLRTPYTVMQLDGINEGDQLALSRSEYTGESKKIDVEYQEQIEENVCLGKPAEADRSTSGNYPLEYALDGDLSTRLGFNGNGDPVTMVIDLENIWDLDTLMIREWKDKSLTGGTRSGNTKCEVSTDGETWETVFENEPLVGGENVRFDMGGRSASMIRLTFDNLESDKAVSIYEIQCSAKKDIFDKQELFQILMEADEYENDPVYGIGVDEELMAAYTQAKADAVDILEGRKGTAQGDVDGAAETLRNALASITGDMDELLAELVEDAEEAAGTITPENDRYVQEYYDQLIAALDAVDEALKDTQDKDALGNAVQRLDMAVRTFKGENVPGAVSVDLDAGIYEGQQKVNLTSDSREVTEYRYTLDGSEPDRNSRKAAEGSLVLPYGLSVLKAAGYTETGARTETVTVKYMCRSEKNLALHQTAEGSGEGYPQYPASYAVDGDPSTRWASRGKDVSLTLTFDNPVTVDSVYIDEFKNSSNTQDNRLYSYTLEYQEGAGGEWTEISSGSVYDTEGKVMAVSESSRSYVAIGFEPVTVSALRITGPDDDETSAAPITFYETEVYGENLANALNDLNEALREAETENPSSYTADSAEKLAEAVRTAEEMLDSQSSEDIRTAAGALRLILDSLEKAKPVITAEPENLSVKAGSEAELSVTAYGNSLGYQWQQYDGRFWRTIEGAVESVYRFTASEESDGAQYRCIISSPGGNAVTETVSITIREDSEEQVSKKTLEYFLNEAKGYVENGTVAGCVESVQELFEEAIAEGDAVMADESASREEVLNAAAKLMFAIHALEMKAGDKTDLEMAAELGDMIDLTQYVEAGQPEFTEALAKAKEVLADGDAFQDEIDSAWDALVAAMENLRLKADKSVLEDLISQTAELDLSGYTEESVSVFRAAFAAANAVFTDEALSVDDQAEVDQAAQALQAAYDGLEKVQAGEPEDPGADSGNQGGTAGDDGNDGTGSQNGGAASGQNGQNSGAASGQNGQNSPNSQDGNTGSGTEKAAKTGDSAPVAAAGMLLILSAGAGIVLGKRKCGR